MAFILINLNLANLDYLVKVWLGGPTKNHLKGQ
jgi:hypothetical protein